MLAMTGTIDVIVPRGGKGLVGRCSPKRACRSSPISKASCHVYIDGAADRDKAVAIAVNAKTRRTGICGAAECLLIDRAAAELGRAVLAALVEAGVEVRGGRGHAPARAAGRPCAAIGLRLRVPRHDHRRPRGRRH
jgi:glutamate-5-semialdehyde dehydrogenase